MTTLRLVDGNAASLMWGRGRTRRYEAITEGTFPPPINPGARDARYVVHEIEAVIRAEIAGASKDDLRALVRRLIAERNPSAPNASARETPAIVRRMVRAAQAKRQQEIA